MTTNRSNKSHPILCGTDFSIHSAEAATVASAISNRAGCELLLVHVDEHAGLEASHPEVLRAVLERTREHLEKEAERLRKMGAEVKHQLLVGSPYEALVRQATTSNARLVVVASTGHIAVGKLLAGSVAERTAEASPTPTLIVRQGARLTAWARGEGRLKVLVGFDFSSSSDAALRWLREWQTTGPCEITVAHVGWPPANLERLGLRGPVSLTENHPEVARVLQRDLEERVHGILGDQPVSYRIVPGWGRADAHLMQLVQEEKPDLVVVGAHQRHGLSRLWLGSVSRSVLHHAPMSVAVVPLPRSADPTLVAIPEIKRVLATTDFSELSRHALPYAYAALRRGGCVKLIHVVAPWELPSPLAPHYRPRRPTEKQHQKQKADCLLQLRASIPSEAESRGILTEVEVIEHRDVADAIREEAERFGADMICLGSHGRGGLSKALLGSVAGSLMKQSPRPLLLVRSPKQ